MSSLDLQEAQCRIDGATPLADDNTLKTLRFCLPSILYFGDPVAEKKAAREQAVLFDVSDRSQLKLTGTDRQAFFGNFCTNDVKRLEPGESCEAFVTSAKGRILAHVRAFAGNDALWIESNAQVDDRLLGHLDRYLFNEDVQMSSQTSNYGELLLCGSAAPALLKSLAPAAANLSRGSHCEGDFASGPVSIRRVDWFNHAEYLLSCQRTTLAAFWEYLLESGAQPGGAQTFHQCRIESGFPFFDLDISEENLAQEASRTEQAISFTKGCYLGQEPIARLDALGHVNRVLCGLRIDTPLPPDTGDPIRSNDGKELGTISSSVTAADASCSLALGMIRTSHSKPGSQVQVIVDDTPLNATVS